MLILKKKTKIENQEYNIICANAKSISTIVFTIVAGFYVPKETYNVTPNLQFF